MIEINCGITVSGVVDWENHIIKVEHFPDGTQKIILPTLKSLYECYDWIYIRWRYENEEELSTLIYVVLHLKEITHAKLELELFYLPNARMDRTHNNKEVFTLKYFSKVINWLGFDYVNILDVHSDVSCALIDRVINHSPKDYIECALYRIQKNEYIDPKDIVLYFPDAGACKRYSSMFPNNYYCYGEKVREWETNKILGLEVKADGIDLSKSVVLMVDDIISYGGSMYYSALTLKDLGCKNIYAYATHTENSVLNEDKGTLIKLLKDGTVKKLYTTNSLFNENSEFINVSDLEVF